MGMYCDGLDDNAVERKAYDLCVADGYAGKNVKEQRLTSSPPWPWREQHGPVHTLRRATRHRRC